MDLPESAENDEREEPAEDAAAVVTLPETGDEVCTCIHVIKGRKSTGILAHNKNMLACVLECITEMYICMCLYRKGHVGISEKDMQSFIKY